MGSFDSGVSSYITGECVVTVHFPINHRGEADVSCYQCPYFRRNYQTCGINGAICEYPSRYVGSQCPLDMVETSENLSVKENE